MASSLSTFRVSRLPAACLGIGSPAALEAYTQKSVVQQLTLLGTPRASQKPKRYALDGRPAVVALAMVSLPPERLIAQAVYAAKACAFSNPTTKRLQKGNPGVSVDALLCFDFTTDNPDLLALMLSFVAQFGDDPPIPLFPSSALPDMRTAPWTHESAVQKTRLTRNLSHSEAEP